MFLLSFPHPLSLSLSLSLPLSLSLYFFFFFQSLFLSYLTHLELEPVAVEVWAWPPCSCQGRTARRSCTNSGNTSKCYGHFDIEIMGESCVLAETELYALRRDVRTSDSLSMLFLFKRVVIYFISSISAQYFFYRRHGRRFKSLKRVKMHFSPKWWFTVSFSTQFFWG